MNKNTHTLRLGFQNIGSFPRERNKIKEENIRIGISTYSFDIFGIVETNTDWRLVPEDLKLHSQLKHLGNLCTLVWHLIVQGLQEHQGSLEGWHFLA